MMYTPRRTILRMAKLNRDIAQFLKFPEIFCSCLLIRTLPLFKSTQSQVKPHISPRRMPVKSIVRYSVSKRCPRIAFKKLLISISSSGDISLCSILGRT